MSIIARRSTAFKNGDMFTPKVIGRGTHKNSIFTPMSKLQSSGSQLIDFSDYLHTEQNIGENYKNDNEDEVNPVKKRLSKFIELSETGKSVMPRRRFALEEFNQDQLLEVFNSELFFYYF